MSIVHRGTELEIFLYGANYSKIINRVEIRATVEFNSDFREKHWHRSAKKYDELKAELQQILEKYYSPQEMGDHT